MNQKAFIKPESCDNSPFCPVRRACPKGAIKSTPQGWVVDESLCTGCGICTRYCPHRAVVMKAA